MYYSVIGILAIMILMIENQDIFLNRDGAFELPAWKIYRRFLFAGLCYYITDALWGIIAYYKLPKLLFAETTLYFIAMAAGILFRSQYVIVYLNDDDSFGAFFVHAGQAVAAFITIVTLVNIFAPVMFTVDANSVYTTQWMRGPVMAIPIVLLLLLSVHALMSILRQGDVEGIRKKYRTIAWFGIIMAFFMLMQIWFVYLPLNSVAYLLGTCLLRAFVIGDEKEEYRRELIEAERIAGLKQSISALLDNMPALTFSKDAETGVYLACNQAFAEYAHKDKPEGVIGLTDAQIFDSETAKHFVEDDRITLERDEPYIFFEDVPDAAGNQRQFQTTKLKFKDADGRLCTLGMCQDVTDLINQRKRAERL